MIEALVIATTAASAAVATPAATTVAARAQAMVSYMSLATVIVPDCFTAAEVW
jgi:hypothetical protein